MYIYIHYDNAFLVTTYNTPNPQYEQFFDSFLFTTRKENINTIYQLEGRIVVFLFTLSLCV
jgi:hypothetical protein